MRITIIGAGPGGYETAVLAAKKGAEVTIITDGPLGGTCLNEGCIPTKTFCRSAEVAETVRRAGEFGVSVPSYEFDMARAVARKDEVVEQLRSGVAALLSGKNITLVRGHASLKDSHTVSVGGTLIGSDYIIIATGSYTAMLPVPGCRLPGVITSTEILDLQELPKRLCIIGAGVIGIEFASIFRGFGSEVQMVEFRKEILPHFDSDMAKRLRLALGKRGIGIEINAAVQSVEESEGGLTVTYVKKGKEAKVEADKVLMAVGRKPNTASLNLDDLGIAYTPLGITVDGDMRTNVPGIFAIGDVCGGYMLAHTAVAQGKRALAAIFGEECGIDLSIVPAAVFCQPEAASVGLTEDQCKETGTAVHVLKSFFRANGKAVSMGEADGFCKILVGDAGRIVGCHILGPHASDIIQEVAALMAVGAGIEDLKDVIHSHPTVGEVILAAAQMY